MDILCSTLILFNKIEATNIRLLYYKGGFSEAKSVYLKLTNHWWDLFVYTVWKLRFVKKVLNWIMD